MRSHFGVRHSMLDVGRSILLLSLLACRAAPAESPAPVTWPAELRPKADGPLSLDLPDRKRYRQVASEWFSLSPYHEYALRFRVRDVQGIDPTVHVEFTGTPLRTLWIWPTDWAPRPPVWMKEEARFITIGGAVKGRLLVRLSAPRKQRSVRPVLFDRMKWVDLGAVKRLKVNKPVRIFNASFEAPASDGKLRGWSTWIGSLEDVDVRTDGAFDGRRYVRIGKGKHVLLVSSASATPARGVYRLSAAIRGTGRLQLGIRTNFPYSKPMYSHRIGDDRWVTFRNPGAQWQVVTAEIPLDVPGLDQIIPLLYIQGPLDVDRSTVELVAPGR